MADVSNRNRQPEGQSIGGQFDNERHAESGVELGVDSTAGSFAYTPLEGLNPDGQLSGSQWFNAARQKALGVKYGFDEDDVEEFIDNVDLNDRTSISNAAADFGLDVAQAHDLAASIRHARADTESDRVQAFVRGADIPAEALEVLIQAGVRTPSVRRQEDGTIIGYSNGPEVVLREGPEGMLVQDKDGEFVPATHEAVSLAIDHTKDQALMSNYTGGNTRDNSYDPLTDELVLNTAGMLAPGEVAEVRYNEAYGCSTYDADGEPVSTPRALEIQDVARTVARKLRYAEPRYSADRPKLRRGDRWISSRAEAGMAENELKAALEKMAPAGVSVRITLNSFKNRLTLSIPDEDGLHHAAEMDPYGDIKPLHSRDTVLPELAEVFEKFREDPKSWGTMRSLAAYYQAREEGKELRIGHDIGYQQTRELLDFWGHPKGQGCD